MAQYFPTYKAKEIEDINRKITKREYKKVEDFLYSLDLENGYIQECGKNEEIYVYRLYLLSPYRIDKEQVVNADVREAKRKTIVHIRTARRKYLVKIYNE